MRAEPVEDYLASQGIQIWSADFLADDWRHISSQRVYDLAIQRIEAKGKGILLLHDIQARTVAALPRILETLKARGYHIVQVVPATPDRPATPTDPQEWRLHPTSEDVAIAHWPKPPEFAVASADNVAVPALADFDGPDGELVPQAEPFDRISRPAHGVPLSREAPWPEQWVLPSSDATALPVPAQTVFEIPELPRPTAEAVARLGPRPQRMAVAGPESSAERSAKALSGGGESRRPARSKRMLRHGRRPAASHQAALEKSIAAHALQGAPKRLAQIKKRSV
jgi:hypothetical protein